MKILLIADNFLPYYGGSRVYYYNICRRLQKHQIIVLTRKIPGSDEFDAKQNFRIERVEFREWKHLKSLRLQEIPIWWALLSRAVKIIWKERPDLLYGAEPPLGGPLCFLLRFLFRIPYILQTHDDPVAFGAARFMPKVNRFVLLKADSVISASHFSRRMVLDLGVEPRKSVVIPNCIEKDLIERRPETDFKQRYGRGAKIILTVGRLNLYKGQDSVIRALPKVMATVGPVIYVIVGKGPRGGELSKLAEEMSVSKEVVILEGVSRGEIADLYRACGVFALISRPEENGTIREGFGVVYLEANLFGKPVIGSRIGGVPEAVLDGETGLLVNWENETEIEAALIRLLTNTELAKRLGENGRKRALEGFHWEDSARQFEGFCEKVVEGAGRGRRVSSSVIGN